MNLEEILKVAENNVGNVDHFDLKFTILLITFHSIFHYGVWCNSSEPNNKSNTTKFENWLQINLSWVLNLYNGIYSSSFFSNQTINENEVTRRQIDATLNIITGLSWKLWFYTKE